MSRAFVREDSADAVEALPDRPISPDPNFVTAAGLAQMDLKLRQLEAERAAARARDEKGALATLDRDWRYWTQRRATARLVQPAADPTVVRFGVTLSVRFADERTQMFTIVGEDEAAPAAGLLGWTSPAARALLGLGLGDAVTIAGKDGEITALTVAEPAP